MRRLGWIIAACVATMASTAVGAGAKPIDWIAYADCAAAYQANARLTDSDRPASMTTQISDVASDYVAAAVKERARMGGQKSAVRSAVEAHVTRQAKLFGRQTRETVEHTIDACPQLDG